MNKINEDFLWGCAIAANQCEGGWKEDGKGETIMDHITSGSRTKPRRFTMELSEAEYYPTHDGVDFYHHYKEDIQLMAGMHLKSLRLSISWARIYPKGTESFPNQKGLDFYRNLLEELKRNNIEPLVTFSHYDMPFFLVKEYGGWKDKRCIDLFCRYCKTVFESYKDLVKYWITFNEINILTMSAGALFSGGLVYEPECSMIPHSESAEQRNDRFNALHNMFVASARAVSLGHAINSEFKIGGMINGSCVYPKTCRPADVRAAQEKNNNSNYFCADVMVRGHYPHFADRWLQAQGVSLHWAEGEEAALASGTVDYLGFSYYGSSCVTTASGAVKSAVNFAAGVKNEFLKESDWGWPIDASGLRCLCNELYGRYEIPLAILENGLGAFDDIDEHGQINDPYRIAYLKEHIRELHNILADGVELIGYYTWGCFDIVSTSTGEMSKRYGLIYVDKNDEGSGTMKRSLKQSYFWYQSVIDSQGENLDADE